MRQPQEGPGEDWLDVLRWVCLAVSRTPPSVIGSISVTAPWDGYGRHLLPSLSRRLAEEYCVSMTVEPDASGWRISVRRMG
jgi:hypothetical protein